MRKIIKLLNVVPVLACIILLGSVMLPGLRADDYDKKTTVTFTTPIAIPPVHLEGWSVLPPGTYVFKLLASQSNRHIVQIFNKEQTKIYATILAIPNYRLQAKDKTVMTFNEGIRGKPESLRAWFYPGANWGEEFVYPKSQAVELAKVVNLPVLAAIADLPVEVAKVDEPAVLSQLSKVPIMAVRPTGEVVELAQVVQAPPVRSPQVNAAPAQQAASPTAQPVTPKELPKTASLLPLIALCGLLALGAGLGVRVLAKINS